MKENDNFDSKINNLEEKLKNFETKLKAEKQQQKDIFNSRTHPKISLFFNVIADISGGVITSFILYHLYSRYFHPSKLVFALLLVSCSISGLYMSIMSIIRKDSKKNLKNKKVDKK